MPHRNAILTETGRLHLAQLVVDQGWTLRRAAERFGVAVNTARRWAQRYRERAWPGWSTSPLARSIARINSRNVRNAGSSGYGSPSAGAQPGSLTTFT